MVGGGVSALGFLLNAYRNEKLDKLISKNGLCIIEKTDKFGGGTLEDNLIPSNTPIIGLIKFIMYEKYSNMLIGDFLQHIRKPNSQEIDYKIIEQSVLPIFKPILDTQIVKNIKQIGGKTGSLQSFGFFLRIVGNQFLRYLLNEKKYKIHVKFENQVQMIKQIPKQNQKNEQQEEEQKKDENVQKEIDYIVYYKKVIKKKKENSKKLKYPQDYCENYNNCDKIIGSYIIQCQGGFQKFNPMYELLDPKKKFTSDQFLKENHFVQALKLFQSNNQRQISIIGGSHSALSAAYILLSGPQFYEEDELENDSEFQKMLMKSCKLCDKNGHNCKCYGNIQPNKKQLNSISDYILPDIQEGQIVIYHRHQFRTSTNFKTNAYSGLRGLALELYEKIVKNQEKRVKLVQFSEFSKIKVKLMQSCFVVECLGYESNYIKTIQQQIQPEQNQRSFKDNVIQQKIFEQDIDGFALMDSQHQINGLQKCYGSGLGFGLQTEHPLISAEKFQNKKIRADSVQVYLCQIPSKIIQEMLNQHTIQEKLDAKNIEKTIQEEKNFEQEQNKKQIEQEEQN